MRKGGVSGVGSLHHWLQRCCTSSALQVFQRREDGSVNFFRGWEAYREGFGKLTGEHWLGKLPALGSPHTLPGPCLSLTRFHSSLWGHSLVCGSN